MTGSGFKPKSVEDLKEFLEKNKGNPAALRQFLEEMILEKVMSKDPQSAMFARMQRDIEHIIERERERARDEGIEYYKFVGIVSDALASVNYVNMRVGRTYPGVTMADLTALAVHNLVLVFLENEGRVEQLRDPKTVLENGFKMLEQTRIKVNAMLTTMCEEYNKTVLNQKPKE